MVETLAAALKILSRRKIASSPGDGGHVLQKTLTVVDITCLGLSTTLGLGIYTLLAYTAKEYTGPSVVVSFLISSVASCLAGLCYSELSNRFPKAGSAYCYVYATLGEIPAFLIGWSMVLEYQLSAALAAKSWIQYIDAATNGTIITRIRLASPFLLKVPGLERGFIDIPSVLVILTVGIILIQNLKISCILNNVMVFMCLLIIGGIVLVSMVDMDADNWTAGTGFFPNGVTGIFSAASICFFSFHGYDIIASVAAESEHRGRIIPVAISLTFLLSLVTCFTASIAITLLVPFSLFDDSAPILKAFDTRNLFGMQYFVISGATCGLISSLIASLIALSHLLFYLANDGLLFAFLSKYNTNSGTTFYATIVSCLLCSAIAMLLDTRTILRLLGTGTIVSYMSSAIAVLYLRYGIIKRLPFEACELMSRDTTISDFRSSQRMTQSISDYYLSQRHNHSDKTEEFDTNQRNVSTEPICNSLRNRSQTNQCNHNCGDYGACGHCGHMRTMSVEFINQSYITSISDLSLNGKEEPSQKSAKFVAGVALVMMIVMLLMGIFTIHVPKIVSHGNELWMEVIASGFFIAITICVVMVVRSPRHRASSRNSIPCVPLLPICAIWMDIHLIVCLPYSSWLAFLIWSLLGVFVYMSYSVWNSKEGTESGGECDEINEFGLTETSDDGDEIAPCIEQVHGSDV